MKEPLPDKETRQGAPGPGKEHLPGKQPRQTRRPGKESSPDKEPRHGAAPPRQTRSIGKELLPGKEHFRP